nr:hypothetical protein [Tanacetum cinerariifolium]
MNKLVKGNHVRGLPSKIFENDHTCVACKKGKQHKASCKSKLVNSVSQPLQILHMDLFGPTFIKSIMGKMYCQVVTNDYSRFSWVFLLAKKDETCGIIKDFITRIESQLNHNVKIIRCDNRTEFKNYEMNQFCGINRIKKEFSNARTPQQNGVAERKNMTLIEAARTMLADSLLPIPFCAEAVNTACYVQNMVLVTKPHNKTPYELLIGKFDGKADEGFLVGYSLNSKAFRVYNRRTKKVKENLHVNFLENKPNVAGSGPEWLFDIASLTNSMNYQPVSVKNRTHGITGSKIHSDVGQEGKEKVSDQEYILLPVLNTNSDVSSRNEEVESSPKDDAGKKSTVEPTCVERGKIDDLGCLDQQMKSINYSENTSSTNNFNTVILTINTASDKDGTFQRTYGEWNFSTPIPVNVCCLFLGSRLISWQYKKQTIMANFTTEAEYIVASNCCRQVLWLQNQLLDYGYNFMQIKIHLDNESVICVVKNLVYHSKTKHIEIGHHFIRDSYKKRLIEMVKIHTNSNVADLLTKAFDVTRF